MKAGGGAMWAALSATAAASLGNTAARADSGARCEREPDGSLSCSGALAVPKGATPALGLAGGVPEGAVEAVLGGSHACARMADGSLACWGENDNGQLGDGTTSRREKATKVSGLSDVAQVVLGRGSTCALRKDGTAFCWGNWGLAPGKRIPAPVAGISDAVELAAGGVHACARRKDESVWCWGYNHYGQLGDGTRQERAQPVRAFGVRDAAEVVAGLYFTCARSRGGLVWCWGNGRGGESGTARHWLSPAEVTKLAGATNLTAASGALFVERAKRPALICTYRSRPGPAGEADPALSCAPRLPGASAEFVEHLESLDLTL